MLDLVYPLLLVTHEEPKQLYFPVSLDSQAWFDYLQNGLRLGYKRSRTIFIYHQAPPEWATTDVAIDPSVRCAILDVAAVGEEPDYWMVGSHYLAHNPAVNGRGIGIKRFLNEVKNNADHLQDSIHLGASRHVTAAAIRQYLQTYCTWWSQPEAPHEAFVASTFRALVYGMWAYAPAVTVTHDTPFQFRFLTTLGSARWCAYLNHPTTRKLHFYQQNFDSSYPFEPRNSPNMGAWWFYKDTDENWWQLSNAQSLTAWQWIARGRADMVFEQPGVICVGKAENLTTSYIQSLYTSASQDWNHRFKLNKKE